MMYLSFVDDDNDTLNGVAIISDRPNEPPAFDIAMAVGLAWSRGCNPGGGVEGWLIDEIEPSWADFQLDRLYTPPELVEGGFFELGAFGPRTLARWFPERVKDEE